MWDSLLKRLLTGTLIFMAACSTQLPTESEVSESVLLPTATPLPPTVSQLPVTTVKPPATATITVEPIPTQSPIVAATPTLSTDLVIQDECPVVIDNHDLLVWTSGSVLYNTGKVFENTLWWPEVEEDGIWAISAANLNPRLVYQPAKNIAVSPDGNMLVSFKAVSEGDSPIMIIYSIPTGKSIEITMPHLEGDPIIGQFPTWLPDGRIVTAARLEQNLGYGETWNMVLVDPKTQAIEQTTLELNLPDYEFFQYDVQRSIPSGFVAVDPTYQVALYTAGDDQHHEIRLANLANGEILWKGQSEYLINSSPQWTQDGQRVLFEVAVPREDVSLENKDWAISFAWSKLVSLNRNGSENVLPTQPFEGLLDHVVNNFSYSPDGRYIFYTFYNDQTTTLHAYIIDTVARTLGEICDSKSRLFGSWPLGSADPGKVDIDWLPNGNLMYRTLVTSDNQWFHSLRVLNMLEWTSRVIFEANLGHGVNMFGWTPIEFH